VKGQGELNRHIIFESALTLFIQNYQSQSVLVEIQLAEVGRFLRHSVVVYTLGQQRPLSYRASLV